MPEASDQPCQSHWPRCVATGVSAGCYLILVGCRFAMFCKTDLAQLMGLGTMTTKYI